MVPPTTLLCWGKIFLFNVEHYQQESLKGFFFTYNFLFLSRYLFKLKSFSLLVTKSVWSCHHHRAPPRHQGPGQGQHDSDHPPQAERGRGRTLEGIITWLSAADGSGPLCESKLIFWVRGYFEEPGAGTQDLSLSSSRAWPDSIMFNQFISDSGTHYN